MNSRLISGCVVVSCLLLGACHHQDKIRANEYKQTCVKDSECKTVLVGDPCKCSCENASINASEAKDYAKDLADMKAECADELVSCTKCPELKASVCVAGKC